MEQMNKTCYDFLKENGMLAEAIDLDLYSDAFRTEIEKALDSRYPSSLAMLNSHIRFNAQLPKNTEAIAIDAGGTNLKICLMAFDNDGESKMLDLKSLKMPGVDEEISIDEFFRYIAEELRDYSAKDAGFCFSYPAAITKDLDAKIIGFKKEIRISGAKGRLVGDGVNKALKDMGLPEKRFTLLNDTSAALLGASGSISHPFGSAMALILGTGTNMCYVEDNYIINTECGNYNGFPQGIIDKELDAVSEEPGLQQAEKMIGGVYLPKIIKSAKDRLGGFEDDIRDEIYHRAAKLVTCEAAGILKHQKTAENRKSYLVAEGSTFMKAEALQKYIYYYFEEFIHKKLGFDVQIIKAENSTLKGAAIAALNSGRK